jgi:hypothetical protein
MTKYNFCVTKIKYIMYNDQDYSDISHNVILPVVCEGWHFIHVETNGFSTLAIIKYTIRLLSCNTKYFIQCGIL